MLKGKTGNLKTRESEEQKRRLETLAKSRTAPWRYVQRSGILRKYMEGETIAALAEHLGAKPPLVERSLRKAAAFGVNRGLKDLSGRGVKPEITDDAGSGCYRSPGSLHVPLDRRTETWTYGLLKEHIREHCLKAGYGMLSRIDKGVLHGTLEKGKIALGSS